MVGSRCRAFQDWVDPLDEYAIEDLWNGFGAKGIAQAYAEHRPLWDKCVEAGAELYDIAAVKDVRTKFQSDVRAVVRVYMRQNKEAVVVEGGRLGLGDIKGGGAKGAGPDPKKLRDLQQMAREVARADDALKRMREMPVGYVWMTTGFATGMPNSRKEVENFNPEKPPESRPDANEKGFAKWEEIKPQYEAVSQARATLVARNPALFMLSGDEKETA